MAVLDIKGPAVDKTKSLSSCNVHSPKETRNLKKCAISVSDKYKEEMHSISGKASLRR